TGGLAYGKVDVEGTSTLSNPIGGTPLPSISQTFDHSNVITGWVVGSGTEGKLFNFPGWTYTIEGFYMDLGHLDATGPVSPPSATTGSGPRTIHFALSAGPVHTNPHFTDTILRAGLSYQFH